MLDRERIMATMRDSLGDDDYRGHAGKCFEDVMKQKAYELKKMSDRPPPAVQKPFSKPSVESNLADPVPSGKDTSVMSLTWKVSSQSAMANTGVLDLISDLAKSKSSQRAKFGQEHTEPTTTPPTDMPGLIAISSDQRPVPVGKHELARYLTENGIETNGVHDVMVPGYYIARLSGGREVSIHTCSWITGGSFAEACLLGPQNPRHDIERCESAKEVLDYIRTL